MAAEVDRTRMNVRHAPVVLATAGDGTGARRRRPRGPAEAVRGPDVAPRRCRWGVREVGALPTARGTLTAAPKRVAHGAGPTRRRPSRHPDRLPFRDPVGRLPPRRPVG